MHTELLINFLIMCKQYKTSIQIQMFIMTNIYNVVAGEEKAAETRNGNEIINNYIG